MGHIFSLLMPIIIYFLLLIPPTICAFVILAKGKKFYKLGFLFLILFSIPLISRIRTDYIEYKGRAYKHPGQYVLKAYPNCEPCLLNIENDNTYFINTNIEVIKQGTWSYKNGDKNIIILGENKQLGIEEFAYDTYYYPEKETSAKTERLFNH
ncbi:hypothetical protein [Kordia sp.]|uniref:hypothetical protein n=1 Tax=Kordia sp. TaxID=1965332 RepID=UPI003D291DEF